MLDQPEQSEIVKSQAALDQAWRNLEPALPHIISVGNNGPRSIEDMELSLMCVRLVGWEISLRVVQRDQYVRCIVLPCMGDALPDEVAVRITTTSGQQTFYVAESAVIFDEDKSDEKATTGRIEIKAVSVRPGVFSIILPTIHQNVILVPDTEVSIG